VFKENSTPSKKIPIFLVYASTCPRLSSVMVVATRRQCRHLAQGFNPESCEVALKKRRRVDSLMFLCLCCGDTADSVRAAIHHGIVPPHHLLLNLDSNKTVCTKCKATRSNEKDSTGVLVESHQIESFVNTYVVPWFHAPSDITVDLTDAIDERFETSVCVNESRLFGIPNIGNSCFLNSILQVLAHSPRLLSTIDRQAVDRNYGSFTSALKDILVAIQYGMVDHRRLSRRNRMVEKRPCEKGVNPQVVFGYIINSAPQLSGFGQQDAHELLVEILRNLEEDDKKNPSFIWELFASQIERKVQCIHCGDSKQQVEDCPIISLDMKHSSKSINLETYLGRFPAMTELLVAEGNGYECGKCCTLKIRRDGVLTEHFSNAPPILAFHFKRFKPCFRNGVAHFEKLDSHVELPEILEFDRCKYALYGVVVHRGKAITRGHYVCYVRPLEVLSSGCRSANWWLASDDKVSHVSRESVFADQAYMAFYERLCTV